jgi:hypothetical protein
VLSNVSSKTCAWPRGCIRNRASVSEPENALKIERLSDRRGTRIRLSGEFWSWQLDQMKAKIERGGPRVDLDLQEFGLVDEEGVRFLNACEAEVMSVLRCSPCTKIWMLWERGVGQKHPPICAGPHDVRRSSDSDSRKDSFSPRQV